MANVIRRLRRVCAFYGANPVFIFCSATIANPQQLAEALLGEEVAAITRAAHRAARSICCSGTRR
jgi:DEAD/DEAH box helicase domain-containing protein